MVAVPCQGLILQWEQHLPKELVLPLPVYMVHGELQHSLGNASARHLRKERTQARVRSGSRGQELYIIYTSKLRLS